MHILRKVRCCDDECNKNERKNRDCVKQNEKLERGILSDSHAASKSWGREKTGGKAEELPELRKAPGQDGEGLKNLFCCQAAGYMRSLKMSIMIACQSSQE
jgi:hypothetical protein